MSLKRCFLLACFVLLALNIQAQITPVAPQKTGIQTRRPSETLDVNGTVRILDLPINNSKIYNGEAVKNTTHNPIKIVVADENGVLGAIEKSDMLETVGWVYLPPIYLPTQNSLTNVTGLGALMSSFISYHPTLQVYTVRMGAWASRHLATNPALISTHSSINNFVRNPSASDDIGYAYYKPYTMNQYSNTEYYVTYYDSEVFYDIKILRDGNLTYKVFPNAVVTSKTYMTIAVQLPYARTR